MTTKSTNTLPDFVAVT